MKLFAIPLLLLLALPAHAATAVNQQAADPVAALLEQSQGAQSRGEAELAQRLAQAAIVADPARPSSYVALGDLYSAQGQVDYARVYYDSALAIDPSDAAALKAEAALGNPPKATLANTQ